MKLFVPEKDLNKPFLSLKALAEKRMKELAIFENIEVPLRTINVTCLQ